MRLGKHSESFQTKFHNFLPRNTFIYPVDVNIEATQITREIFALLA